MIVSHSQRERVSRHSPASVPTVLPPRRSRRTPVRKPVADIYKAEDRDLLLAFYDCPAEHWIHLRDSSSTTRSLERGADHGSQYLPASSGPSGEARRGHRRRRRVQLVDVAPPTPNGTTRGAHRGSTGLCHGDTLGSLAVADHPSGSICADPHATLRPSHALPRPSRRPVTRPTTTVPASIAAGGTSSSQPAGHTDCFHEHEPSTDLRFR